MEIFSIFEGHAAKIFFFKEHSPLLVRLAPLVCRTRKYAKESLGDIGVLPIAGADKNEISTGL